MTQLVFARTYRYPGQFQSSWLSVCQKLSNLVEIWWSSDKNKLGHFFDTPCRHTDKYWERDRYTQGQTETDVGVGLYTRLQKRNTTLLTHELFIHTSTC